MLLVPRCGSLNICLGELPLKQTRVCLILTAKTLLKRYHVPWAIVTTCYITSGLLLLVQRCLLARENKRRDQEPPDDTYDDVWVKITNEDGETVEKRVDKAFLDLTDRQNRDFRYVL